MIYNLNLDIPRLIPFYFSYKFAFVSLYNIMRIRTFLWIYSANNKFQVLEKPIAEIGAKMSEYNKNNAFHC